MEIERKFSIREIVLAITVLGPVLTGGIFVYHQGASTANDVEQLKNEISATRQANHGLDMRMVRMETRMDTIIEQNSQILRHLSDSARRGGANLTYLDLPIQ